MTFYSPTLDEIDRLNALGGSVSNIQELHEKFLKTFEEVRCKSSGLVGWETAYSFLG